MNEQNRMYNDVSSISYPVDFRRISTPRESCLTLTIGYIDEGVVVRAQGQRFDQLPVLDDSGLLRGVVAVEYAHHLLDQGQALDESDQAINLCEIDEQPPLLTLLTQLSHHRAVIFATSTTVRRGTFVTIGSH